jgi:hypothetical protein
MNSAIIYLFNKEKSSTFSPNIEERYTKLENRRLARQMLRLKDLQAILSSSVL